MVSTKATMMSIAGAMLLAGTGSLGSVVQPRSNVSPLASSSAVDMERVNKAEEKRRRKAAKRLKES